MDKETKAVLGEWVGQGSTATPAAAGSSIVI